MKVEYDTELNLYQGLFIDVDTIPSRRKVSCSAARNVEMCKYWLRNYIRTVVERERTIVYVVLDFSL